MGILALIKGPHFILVLVFFICQFKPALVDLLDDVLPTVKVTTLEYRFLVQLFRRWGDNRTWTNIGQASLVTETKAFTAAIALYRDRKNLIGYSNIACYGTEGEDEYIPEYNTSTMGPPFHATRLMVSGGRTGLGLITFVEKISLFKTPIPFRTMGMTDFEPCISLSWIKSGKTAELSISYYTTLPRERCMNRYKKLYYHICGRSDSKPKSYLGDGDLGAAFICANRLTGVGLPIKRHLGYENETATFVGIVYLHKNFNLEDDKGHMLELHVYWELTCCLAIFWKNLINV